VTEPVRAVRSNGSHQAYGAEMPRSAEPVFEGAPKTLEDSIKDMLRPMLRQWLDENMARVLTAALKDELRDNPARLQPD
jgi:cell pole-organizing protein PopZ